MTLKPTERLQVAVSAAIFKDDKVLLVRRARKPAFHVYTFPGGRVEYGEPLTIALAREVMEETGLTIEIIGLAGYRESLPVHNGIGHYVILPFSTRWVAGDVTLNEELDDFKWLEPGQFGDLPLTEGLHGITDAARRLAGV